MKSYQNHSHILTNQQKKILKRQLRRNTLFRPTENVKEEISKTRLIPPFKKGYLGNIIAEVFKQYKITETSKMLDRMKDLRI